MLFLFGPSSFSGLQPLTKCEAYLSQSPTCKIEGGSNLEFMETRQWLHPSPASRPWLRQLPLQECCHLPVFGCTLSCLKTMFGLSSTPVCHIPLVVWYKKSYIVQIVAGQQVENIMNFLSCCLQYVFNYCVSVTFQQYIFVISRFICNHFVQLYDSHIRFIF